MPKKKKATYEDFSDTIDFEIKKRRGKWRLSSLAWIDFDDVEQIIRVHLFRKWDQWDQRRPLLPWINKIITNQLKNILRNYYHNFVKPCVSCPFNQSQGDEGELCGFTKTGLQDKTCPLFLKWSKVKKYAYDVKMPVPLENIPVEIGDMKGGFVGLERAINKVHVIMENYLSEKQFKIYHMLFVQHLDEEEVALKMGYKTSEKGRKAGYKQIKNLKKIFKEKTIKILNNHDIFYQ